MSGGPPSISWVPVEEINLNGTCAQLYFGNMPISTWGINPLQLTILITTLVFVLFLLIRIPCSVSTLKRNPSNLSRVYYIFVWVASLMCCSRIFLSWFAWKEMSMGAEILWVINAALFWGLEVSVLVFLFSSQVSSASKLIIRVLLLTFAAIVVFATVQAIVVFVAKVKLYEYTPLSLYWWAPFNAIRTAIYLFILTLRFIPCIRGIAIPKVFLSAVKARPAFYIYSITLCLIHVAELIGVALVFTSHRSEGFCFVDASIIAYFSFYSPLLYLMFLKDYFHPVSKDAGYLYIDNSHEVYEYDSINP